MNKNKQSMKLYTEEEVLQIIGNVNREDEKNIEQDRKYWYAKGKWDGSWKTFWICFGIQAILNYYLIIWR